MALSLFGGKKHLHHFVEEQDVAKEFFALLVEAKTMYLRDVVAGSMGHRTKRILRIERKEYQTY